MPLRVNTNVSALNAQRALKLTGKELVKHMERLSSGMRVNRAADDAAGLSHSEGLRGEISGFLQGIRNSEQASNLIQTAEGALSEVNAILVRMRELAVQSSSSTVNDGNRQSLNAEFVQLVSEVDRIASVTSYNNTTLLTGFGNQVSTDVAVSTALASATTGIAATQITGAAAGTYVFVDAAADSELTLGNGVATQTLTLGPSLDFDAVGAVVATGSSVVAHFDRMGVTLTLSGQKPAQGSIPATDGYRDGDLDSLILQVDPGTGGTFQVGPDEGAVHRIEATIQDLRASGAVLNLSSASVSTIASSRSAISRIDQAIGQVVRSRGGLGALQNRFRSSIEANAVMAENDQATDGSIRDADVAAEVSMFARSQILQRSGLSMFAQANLSAAQTLALL
jgi:flagellin